MTTFATELVVYTCITGGYDELSPVGAPEPGVRYVCFTDRAVADARGWELRPVPRSFGHPVLENRWAKMHPHLLFEEAACSLYIDGNILLKQDVLALSRDALARHDLALYAHPFRRCIYQEAAECAAIGHAWVWDFARQMRRYERAGMPEQAGLFECNILFRRHHAPAVVAVMQDWWDEFCHGVRRDQLSLPYLLRNSQVPVCELGPSHIRTGNAHFGICITHNAALGWRDLRGRVNRLMLPVVKLRPGR